jgi:4-amino-4-deoxy-L-arabinose transferase-like glycosyltransferase
MEASTGEAGSGERARGALRLVLLAALLHGLAHLLLLPAWMGEDEPWHVEYAHYVAAGHPPFGGVVLEESMLERLSPSQAQVLRHLGGVTDGELHATQRAILASMREHGFWHRVDWAASGAGAETFDQVSPYFTATHQPPLYYVLGGLLLRVAGGGDVLREMWLLRALALLAYLVVVRLAWAVGERLGGGTTLAAACALVVAWWPMHARQAAVVNNDVLVKVFTSWALLVALDVAREGWTRRRALAGAAALGLALASKTTGVGALVPLGLAAAARAGRGRLRGGLGRKAVVLGAVGLLLALVPVAYLLGNNPAIPRTLENVVLRLAHVVRGEFWDGLLRKAVGSFGWEERPLADGVHVAVRWTLAGLGLGVLAALARRTEGLRRGAVLLCGSALAAQLAVIGLRGVATGRYASPQVVAFGALVAVGALGALPERLRPRALVALGLALLALDAAFLWGGLVWNQYGVWGA